MEAKKFGHNIESLYSQAGNSAFPVGVKSRIIDVDTKYVGKTILSEIAKFNKSNISLGNKVTDKRTAYLQGLNVALN